MTFCILEDNFPGYHWAFFSLSLTTQVPLNFPRKINLPSLQSFLLFFVKVFFSLKDNNVQSGLSTAPSGESALCILFFRWKVEPSCLRILPRRLPFLTLTFLKLFFFSTMYGHIWKLYKQSLCPSISQRLLSLESIWSLTQENNHLTELSHFFKRITFQIFLYLWSYSVIHNNIKFSFGWNLKY